MPWLRRLWFLVRRPALDRQLREEMQWHLEERTRALIAEGCEEAEARLRARRAFGNPTYLREQSRDAWSWAWLDSLLQDVRHAFRGLVRQPLLAAVAVLSLGLTMSACCAVFALADAILLASLPVPEPERLIVLRWVSGPHTPFDTLDGWSVGNDRENSSSAFSLDAFLAARARATGRADVFGFADLYQVNVSVGGEAQVASGQVVSGNYFSALGLVPAAGRLIGPSDDRVDAPEVAAVISNRFWRQRFGGRHDAIGSTIRVNQVPVVVIGVAPAGFEGTRQVGETADVSLPLALRDRVMRETANLPGQTGTETLSHADPRYFWVNMMARLKRAVDGASLRPELERAVRGTLVASGPDAAGETFHVEIHSGARGMTELRDDLVSPIGVMAAIVALVIAIACANLTTLLLARAAAREREVSMRHALGASRARLVRASLVESTVLGMLGGAVGLLGSGWLARGLLPALSLDQAGVTPGMSIATLAFTFLAALVTSLLFGLVPALRASDVGSSSGVRQASAGVASHAPRLRTARTVLTLQVALSVVALVAAGLLVRTVNNLEHVPLGFDSRNVLLFRVDPTLNRYEPERVRHLYAALVDRLRALPGVVEASFSHNGLVSRSSSVSTLHSVDGAKANGSMVNRLIVDDRFFRTMRVPLLAGSTFSGLERESGVRPVVINRRFAERVFHSAAPLGHRFRFSGEPGLPDYEVIGVVGDIAVVDLRRETPLTAYFSYKAEDVQRATFAVRAAGPPDRLVPELRRVVAAVDPSVPVDRVETQDERIAASLERERLFARLASGLGLLALLLACIGIYGVMAYAVTRRTTEIGIRLALGARPARILLMVLAESGRVLVVGAIVGVAIAFVATRALATLLFGLAPGDLLTQVVAVGVLAIVTLAAALVPARRAAYVDPLVALRHD